jgi:hypothetical protein
LGGGNYEAINVTHKVTAAPPHSLAMLQGPYGFFPVVFWIIFHPLTELLFVLTLIFNWRIPQRRSFLLVAFVGTVLLRVATMLYFAPETEVITSVPYSETVDEALLVRARQWESWNYLRLAGYYAVAIILLFVINRGTAVRHDRAVR